MKADDLFKFAIRTTRDTFPIDPIRAAASPSPVKTIPSNKPRECCANFAVVTETDAERSIWRCGICGRLWSVAHR